MELEGLAIADCRLTIDDWLVRRVDLVASDF
jgi:hypothetical protein